jgi:hypothetical protein
VKLKTMADGTFLKLRTTVGEWFLQNAALQAARAHVPRPDEPAERAFEQARLLREVTRRVAEPVEELPAGRRAALLLSLYRDFVYWALVADGKGENDVPTDLGASWKRTPADRLLRAAGNASELAEVRRALVDLTPTESLAATDADVARVRVFAESLFADLQAPRQRVDRIVGRRWRRFGVAAAAVLALFLGMRAMLAGPNLAKGKPFATSSSWAGCPGDPGCMAQLFHTNPQDNPWIEFDLGKPTRVHRIDVENRDDCCQDRAVPLVAELSNDRVSWKEVARRDKDFATWVAKFPATSARYVRLRVPRSTTFHLHQVAIR